MSEKPVRTEEQKKYFREYYRNRYVGKTTVCSCGKHLALGSLKKHLKSKYHLKYAPPVSPE